MRRKTQTDGELEKHTHHSKDMVPYIIHTTCVGYMPTVLHHQNKTETPSPSDLFNLPQSH